MRKTQDQQVEKEPDPEGKGKQRNSYRETGMSAEPLGLREEELGVWTPGLREEGPGLDPGSWEPTAPLTDLPSGLQSLPAS